LASIAGDAPALLLIDQLDAVSLASGRMPESFGAVAELLQGSGRVPGDPGSCLPRASSMST